MTDETNSDPAQDEPDSDERLWAMLAHISFFVLGIVAPLLIMLCHESLIHKKSKFVEYHAKQALVYQAVSGAMILFIAVVTCGFGVIIVPAFMVFPILAAIAANNGEWYSYPLLDSAIKP